MGFTALLLVAAPSAADFNGCGNNDNMQRCATNVCVDVPDPTKCSCFSDCGMLGLGGDCDGGLPSGFKWYKPSNPKTDQNGCYTNGFSNRVECCVQKDGNGDHEKKHVEDLVV